ncbi:MAG: GNAT family N-acetyltransferase [Zhenhengia sp.]|uniref:GNAT family N-acetyltransferase n=1 Tax=Zhenhengia sp. TaxID=2944208 RepID=UPI00399686AB
MEAYIMNKINQTWTKDGFVLRLAQVEDAEAYFQQNFNPLDSEVARLTGCKEVFTHDEVINFFMQCVDDDDRYDFLIINPDGRIIGESVINEIDWKARSANFRIAIFQSAERGRGIGSWAIKATRDFAFEKLKLHRLELDVFSFNPSAEKAYQSAGFKREGVLRDAIWNGKEFADDILMAILEDEWKQIKVNS